MASWAEIRSAAPGFVAAVQEYFDARTHKTLATVRKDGAPRISGIEAMFRDEDLWFGGMWQSRKALDLQRDPRFALHSASIDPPDWKGDAKISGRVEEITDPARVEEVIRPSGGGDAPGPSHLFRADVTEVVLLQLGDPADHLVIESWHEGRGLRRVERR